MNLILIGFMGCGKSTVAKPLSQLRGATAVEMDELVYQKTGTRDMLEVFAQGGELLLRTTEIALAQEYAPKKRLVVSTGAGVVLNKITLDYFKAEGAHVIFLNAPFDLIARRLEGDLTRPLFKNLSDAKKIYTFRLPLYAQYADSTIDVDSRTPDEIAHMIHQGLPHAL